MADTSQDVLQCLYFEHASFVVFDKPENRNFHSEDGECGFFEQVNQAFQQRYQQRLYPVHRLDKMTSGLLIAARSREAAHVLNDLFAEQKVEKFYLAVSCHKAKKKQGSVIGDMVRSRRASWRLLTSRENPAITSFKTQSITEDDTFARLYLLRPKTGKTHQIRVAMSSLSASIEGDPIYNRQHAAQTDRGYLHAYALHFDAFGEQFSLTCAPKTGRWFTSYAATRALAAWEAPWSLDWPNV